MDSAHNRISDPDYVRLALSGLDDLFTEEPVVVDVEFATEEHITVVEEVSATESIPASHIPDEPAGEQLDSSEFFEHFFGVKTEYCRTESATIPVESDAVVVEEVDSSAPRVIPFPQPDFAPETDSLDNTVVSGPDDAVAVSLSPLLEKLKDAHGQVQSANYRIGYLQQELDCYKEKLNLLEDLESKAAKAAALQQENEELKKLLPIFEARANKVSLVKRENEQLLARIRQLEAKRGGFLAKIFRSFFN